jgi:hypothetical protein
MLRAYLTSRQKKSTHNILEIGTATIQRMRLSIIIAGSVMS